jgi:hypothetical protein
MTQEGLSSNNEGQFSYQARYGRIELKELDRTVLVQYYVCSSNIPCVRVLGYIQEGSAARVSGEQEFEDEMHLPAIPWCPLLELKSEKRSNSTIKEKDNNNSSAGMPTGQ